MHADMYKLSCCCAAGADCALIILLLLVCAYSAPTVLLLLLCGCLRCSGGLGHPTQHTLQGAGDSSTGHRYLHDALAYQQEPALQEFVLAETQRVDIT